MILFFITIFSLEDYSSFNELILNNLLFINFISGSAVFTQNSNQNLSIKNSFFYNCISNSNGGGIYASVLDSIINNCCFVECKASNNGQSFSISSNNLNSSYCTIFNCPKVNSGTPINSIAFYGKKNFIFNINSTYNFPNSHGQGLHFYSDFYVYTKFFTIFGGSSTNGAVLNLQGSANTYNLEFGNIVSIPYRSTYAIVWTNNNCDVSKMLNCYFKKIGSSSPITKCGSNALLTKYYNCVFDISLSLIGATLYSCKQLNSFTTLFNFHLNSYKCLNINSITQDLQKSIKYISYLMFFIFKF